MKKLAGLIVVMMLGACGGSGDDQVGNYNGTWNANGHFKIVCPGVPIVNDDLTDEKWEFVEGTDSDLVSNDDDGCLLKWDLVKKAAVVRSGQKCNYIEGDDKVNMTFESGSFSTQDGKSGQLDVSGEMQLQRFGNPTIATCTFEWSVQVSRP